VARVGLEGVVVGEGDTYETALDDVRSAIRSHSEAFGEQAVLSKTPVPEAFVAEAAAAVRWTK